jgi:hypothetical protein
MHLMVTSWSPAVRCVGFSLRVKDQKPAQSREHCEQILVSDHHDTSEVQSPVEIDGRPCSLAHYFCPASYTRTRTASPTSPNYLNQYLESALIDLGSLSGYCVD